MSTTPTTKVKIATRNLGEYTRREYRREVHFCPQCGRIYMEATPCCIPKVAEHEEGEYVHSRNWGFPDELCQAECILMTYVADALLDGHHVRRDFECTEYRAHELSLDHMRFTCEMFVHEVSQHIDDLTVSGIESADVAELTTLSGALNYYHEALCIVLRIQAQRLW